MNRDWSARTQPETDGKVELLRRYPGVLFIDAHEMGSETYFFPPNPDPVYHEIADPAVDWINDIYGASMQDAFDERGIPYFNYDTYDLFYAGYGDTVPGQQVRGRRHDVEKASGDPAPSASRAVLTQWTSLSAAATNKERILREWHGSWVEALRQGEAGQLKPNGPTSRACPSAGPCPPAACASSARRRPQGARGAGAGAPPAADGRRGAPADGAALRARLPRLRPRAGGVDAARRHVLGAMAQRQKHWVQAMLNESTYTPVGYAYDIVGWSSPLLFNVAGGSSGAVLSPKASVAAAQAEPAPPALPAKRPSVAVYSMSPQFSRGIEWGAGCTGCSTAGASPSRRVGDRHRQRRPQRRGGPAGARRLRAQGPQRSV